MTSGWRDQATGDAAGRPIVDDIGSPNQLSGGIGAAYA
jgi:hypothetical protein